MSDETEHLCVCPDCGGIATDAVAEIQRLRAHLDPEAYLVHAGKSPGQKTGFEFAVSSPIVCIIANHMAAMLQAHGAENYVEMGFTHDKLGPLTLVVQRDHGDTPACKVAEREAEIERLRKALGSARELIAEIREQDFESYTLGGDPASMDEAEAGWIGEYDAVLAQIDEVTK